MSREKEHPEDAITAEEMESTSLPQDPANLSGVRSTTPSNKRPNAFSELMSPKSKQPKQDKPPKKPREPHAGADTASKSTSFLGRDGLGAYITSPESLPSSRVVYHTSSFVVINDLYPKSSVHLLLLPRDTTKTLLHPFEAFEDAAFLASVKAETARVKDLVAGELCRKYGKRSKKDGTRNDALDRADNDDAAVDLPLPPGRDWSLDVKAGVHAHPSMNHLHVHILSRDMYSPCMKHRKHYNSFNTPFLVPIEDFPLVKDDPRRHSGEEGYLRQDLKCWRCGENFVNQFAKLKAHLDREFEEWVRE